MAFARADNHWLSLKSEARRRCRGWCELCLLRRGRQLHHRHYRTLMAERLEDVMLLCDPCHAMVSGKPKANAIAFREGSLLDLGDTGLGDSALWGWWLANSPSVVKRLLPWS